MGKYKVPLIILYMFCSSWSNSRRVGDNKTKNPCSGNPEWNPDLYIAILNYECVIASITNLLVKVNNHNSAVWVLCLANKHAHQPACICAVGQRIIPCSVDSRVYTITFWEYHIVAIHTYVTIKNVALYKDAARSLFWKGGGRGVLKFSTLPLLSNQAFVVS